jgi:hypothetical protein
LWKAQAGATGASGSRPGGVVPLCATTTTPCGGGFGVGSSVPWDYFDDFGANVYEAGQVIGTWTVPLLPRNANNGDYLAIWNGIASTATGEVVQPVLQFGQTLFGSQYQWVWSIQAWDWIADGVYYVSSPQIVYPGDTLTGNVTIDPYNNYTIWLQVNGAWSIAWLSGTSPSVFDYVMGGILEAHNPSACYALPGGYGAPSNYTEVTFNDIGVGDRWGNAVWPTWSTHVNPVWASYYLPSCDLQVWTGEGWGVLYWRNAYAY